MDKNTIRKWAREKRAAIQNRDLKEAIIHKKAESYIDKASLIAIYHSFQDEVDTLKLIQMILDKKKRVVCPVIEDGTMIFREVFSMDDFQVGHFGVMEPKGENCVNPRQIDLVFIPMLAFNESMYRVGYGKGYYDRFLIKTDAKRVGLAFEAQYINEQFEDEYDIACSVILTEERG